MTTRRISDLAAATVTLSARDENTGEEVSIQLPIVRGSAGAPAVDISSLPAATGLYTLDPGFVATGSCRSAITFIDGPAGVLLHRGYGIDDLAALSRSSTSYSTTGSRRRSGASTCLPRK
jgi:hypothetical protein